MYDAFGVLIASPTSTANSYQYTGEYWDTDLGLFSFGPVLQPRRRKSIHGHLPGQLRTILLASTNTSIAMIIPLTVQDPSGHELNITGMQFVTALSVGMNAYSAGVNIRQGRYAMAAVDILNGIRDRWHGWTWCTPSACHRWRWSSWIDDQPVAAFAGRDAGIAGCCYLRSHDDGDVWGLDWRS